MVSDGVEKMPETLVMGSSSVLCCDTPHQLSLKLTSALFSTWLLRSCAWPRWGGEDDEVEFRWWCDLSGIGTNLSPDVSTSLPAWVAVAEKVSAAEAVHASSAEGARRVNARDFIATVVVVVVVWLFGRGALEKARKSRAAAVTFGAALFVPLFPSKVTTMGLGGDCARFIKENPGGVKEALSATTVSLLASFSLSLSVLLLHTKRTTTSYGARQKGSHDTNNDTNVEGMVVPWVLSGSSWSAHVLRPHCSSPARFGFPIVWQKTGGKPGSTGPDGQGQSGGVVL